MPRTSPTIGMSRSDSSIASNAPSLRAHVLEDALVLEHVEVRERDGGAHGVPAEGEPVRERVGALAERLGDAVGGDHRAHRRVGGGQALGRGDDVGLVAELLARRSSAEAAPRADDLVGDEAGRRTRRRSRARAGSSRAAGRSSRPSSAPARGSRTTTVSGPSKWIRSRIVSARLLGAAAAAPVGVRVGHVRRAGEQRLERLARGRDAGGAQRAERRAVVGELARDDLVAAGVAGELVVLAGELERRVDGLRAAAGEEDAVEVARARARRRAPRARSRAGARSPSSCRRRGPWPGRRRPGRRRRGRGRCSRRTGRRGRRGSGCRARRRRSTPRRGR